MTRLRICTVLATLLGACLLFGARPAAAQTCSATVSSIEFGNVALLSSSPTDVTGTLSVTCTSIPLLSVVKICPSIRAGSGGWQGAARLMTSGANTLEYQLYQDASRTAAWGAVDNTSLGTVPAIIVPALLGGSGTATATIYARVFGGQTSAPAGNYRSDFTGNATAFTYSAALLGASTSCVGFVGSATIQPTFSVTAEPARTCTIGASALAFPVTGVLNRNITAQGQLTVTCTAQTPNSVALSTGNNPIAGVRRMISPAGAAISYGLFSDSQYAKPWGSASLALPGTGTGNSQLITVYGRVPPQTTPAPGTYTDTVIATITY